MNNIHFYIFFTASPAFFTLFMPRSPYAEGVIKPDIMRRTQ
ncbi:hypothetical protein EDWATA_03066 [Edwardsiella tarda ATCC 23685]|uniref:Uncharacterized protein n=1 Tax=Edwardsiella tarda ATCC 23685 TaxID=500638 RepID=D4F8H3_EDWTA|nr:hypothetical protein EDWATA_03066 [Edwardsiella tarda ATCC 23685]